MQTILREKWQNFKGQRISLQFATSMDSTKSQSYVNRCMSLQIKCINPEAVKCINLPSTDHFIFRSYALNWVKIWCTFQQQDRQQASS